MDYLKQQLEHISAQLKTLTLSGRIAAGLLVVLVAIGVMWLSSAGTSPSWTTLLDQPFEPAEAQRVRGELVLVGIEARVEGDRVLVRGGEDSRQRAQALLAQKGALPRDMSIGFQALIEKSNPFVGDREMDRRWNVGLQNEIAGVIEQFPGVREATVLIQVPRKRGLMLNSHVKDSASASVNVKLGYGARLTDAQVTAIASFVSGAVEGLTPMNVSITDGARHYRAEDPNEAFTTRLLDKQREEERHYREMIYDQFQFIAGLVANVHVRLRDSDEHVESKELGKPAVSSETEKSMETRSASGATGPGVRPNQGASVTDATPGSSSTTSETRTEFSPDRDTRVTVTSRPLGFVEHVTASISVPHRYLEDVYRKQNGIEPDVAVTHEQLQALANLELKDIERQVHTLLLAKKDKDQEIEPVSVDWYYDLPERTSAASVEAAADASGYAAMMREYGPQIGLVLLALIPLWLVVRMAKRAQFSVAAARQARANAKAAESEMLEALGGAPVTVGEAQAMHSAMIGHEVDEGLVRTQQIVEQISELVKEDPTSAGSIVQGWLQEART